MAPATEALLKHRDFDQRLKGIADDLRIGQPSPTPTAREFLSWIGASRRGPAKVALLRRGLSKHGLATEPDFESAFIDADIKFVLASEAREAEPQAEDGRWGDTGSPETTTASDPTYRVSRLKAANSPPMSVKPDDSLEDALTKMLENDFSQLPVIAGERDLKGVITWKGIGSRLAMGKAVGAAREFMDCPEEVLASTSLFRVIEIVVRHDYVLVRGPDRRVVGIVTASDLSLQFRDLTEPFLLAERDREPHTPNHRRPIHSSRASGRMRSQRTSIGRRGGGLGPRRVHEATPEARVLGEARHSDQPEAGCGASGSGS